MLRTYPYLKLLRKNPRSVVPRGGRQARGPRRRRRRRRRRRGWGGRGGSDGGGPERLPLRFRGGSGACRPHGRTRTSALGQRQRPHDPPPRARPIKSAPTPLRLRRWLLAHIPGGRRLSSLPRTRRRWQR